MAPASNENFGCMSAQNSAVQTDHRCRSSGQPLSGIPRIPFAKEMTRKDTPAHPAATSLIVAATASGFTATPSR